MTAADRPEVDDPRVLALAKARQQMAHDNPFNVVCPPWEGLSEQEQRLSLLDARNYLRAALKAGLCASSAVSVVPPATNQAALRDRVAEALVSWTYRGKEPDPGIGMLETVRANAYSRADAVLGVLPAPADQAAALNRAADEVFALDYDAMVGEEGDENLGSMREAWDLGTIHAEKLLRRLAAEAPHAETRPRRGDAVEQWLKAQRDEYEVRSSPQWGALDEVLDTYRLHADMGASLGEHVCEGRVVGDCECLEQPAAPAVVAQPGKETQT
ncbi:hypothetical protein [Streptomyces scabiei]|uniref:hypothetical protein n=1 Tax=Streptomyces scabiei TaxID=1930 RepID=UPI001B312397|nr:MULTISPECIES: hypothetical protein [Streptomyces]MDX2794628.1 hypothetical protein [Streptomyces scabiei]MDX3822370.1 hypothetical protein [Streptomyces scabiei]QTU57372.1 hypothetical protein F3K21_35105 [Streptomyces sp. LBUM 1480]